MRLHSRSIHTFVAAGLVTSLFVCYAFGGDCLFPTSCICCNGSFPPGVCKDCGGPTQCCPYVFDVNQAYPCVESAQGREGWTEDQFPSDPSSYACTYHLVKCVGTSCVSQISTGTYYCVGWTQPITKPNCE
jgi:hypothetical protein